MSTAPRVATGTVVAMAVLLTMTACGSEGRVDGGGSVASPPTALAGEVTVFAAASLTDAFRSISDAFEAAHPSVTVRLNLAGSQQLAGQILSGAPADVFASADAVQMQRVSDADLIAGQATTFVTNELAIAVEPGNPLDIDGLDDLADPGLVVVLAADEVPAGRYAAQALDNAGIELTAASLETDVRSVLSKVRLGEADAGIVYRSDVVAAGGAVAAVPIPPEVDVTARNPIAVLDAGANMPAANAFMQLVLSDDGQAILDELGFGAP